MNRVKRVKRVKREKEKRGKLVKLQQEFRYSSEDMVRSMGRKFGYKMKGLMHLCKGYSIGKTRQYIISKEAVPRSKNASRKMFMDITSVKH